MQEIEKNTNTVEEFIQECLHLNIGYEKIMNYLITNHNG